MIIKETDTDNFRFVEKLHRRKISRNKQKGALSEIFNYPGKSWNKAHIKDFQRNFLG